MPDGVVVEDPLGGKIVTGVFAFNPSGDIDRQLAETARLYPNVADFIVIPGAAGYFAARTMRVCGFEVRDEDVANGYVRYAARGIGLAVIFGLLNSIAAIRRFSGHNFLRYLAGSWDKKKPSVVAKSPGQAGKVISGGAQQDVSSIWEKLGRIGSGAGLSYGESLAVDVCG
jgi:hypothetical protein